jgi:hypothetical protein
MNRILAVVSACVFTASGAALADDAHHPDAAKTPPAAAPARPAAKGMDGMGHMQERMHEQMSQIRAATDPKDRERLMAEHMKTMQESMSMMQGMMNCGKM